MINQTDFSTLQEELQTFLHDVTHSVGTPRYLVHDALRLLRAMGNPEAPSLGALGPVDAPPLSEEEMYRLASPHRPYTMGILTLLGDVHYLLTGDSLRITMPSGATRGYNRLHPVRDEDGKYHPHAEWTEQFLSRMTSILKEHDPAHRPLASTQQG